MTEKLIRDIKCCAEVWKGVWIDRKSTVLECCSEIPLAPSNQLRGYQGTIIQTIQYEATEINCGEVM
jgi:hypothetical protein